jgi:hypothetical protein
MRPVFPRVYTALTGPTSCTGERACSNITCSPH